MTLTATAVDPITWYDDLGNVVGTGNSFTTPVLTTTTTYYAVAMDHCASNQVPAVATVNPVSADPVTTGGSVCGSGTVTLNATSPDPITWYDDLGNVVGTGNSFTTPVLTTTTTYYAVAGTLCPSAQVPAVATVNTLPTVDIGSGSDTIVVFTSTYVLDAGAGFSGYSWSTTETTQTITVNATGSYCVTVTDANNCTANDCVYLDFITGINENTLSGVSIYPNPSHGLIEVTLPANHNLSTVIVYDEWSRMIVRETITGRNHFDIDGIALAKGI